MCENLRTPGKDIAGAASEYDFCAGVVCFTTFSSSKASRSFKIVSKLPKKVFRLLQGAFANMFGEFWDPRLTPEKDIAVGAWRGGGYFLVQVLWSSTFSSSGTNRSFKNNQ